MDITTWQTRRPRIFFYIPSIWYWTSVPSGWRIVSWYGVFSRWTSSDACQREHWFTTLGLLDTWHTHVSTNSGGMWWYRMSWPHCHPSICQTYSTTTRRTGRCFNRRRPSRCNVASMMLLRVSFLQLLSLRMTCLTYLVKWRDCDGEGLERIKGTSRISSRHANKLP